MSIHQINQEKKKKLHLKLFWIIYKIFFSLQILVRITTNSVCGTIKFIWKKNLLSHFEIILTDNKIRKLEEKQRKYKKQKTKELSRIRCKKILSIIFQFTVNYCVCLFCHAITIFLFPLASNWYTQQLISIISFDMPVGQMHSSILK